MPRPEIINITRILGAISIAFLSWFGVYSFFVDGFQQRQILFTIFCLLSATTLFISLIGLWQLKRWGVILLGILVAIFLFIFSWVYLNGGVNSLCPTAVFLLGGGLVINLWKTINTQK